jgi:large subunit ribosomal protein L23
MHTVIKKPLITEKSLGRAAKGLYTFAVDRSARKMEIGAEVAALYGVTVVDVHTVHQPGKTRRAGKKMRTVTSPDWKKAIVRVAAGQTIDAFAVAPVEQGKK